MLNYFSQKITVNLNFMMPMETNLAKKNFMK